MSLELPLGDPEMEASIQAWGTGNERQTAESSGRKEGSQLCFLGPFGVGTPAEQGGQSLRPASLPAPSNCCLFLGHQPLPQKPAPQGQEGTQSPRRCSTNQCEKKPSLFFPSG